MINEAFLICALSLPSLSARNHSHFASIGKDHGVVFNAGSNQKPPTELEIAHEEAKLKSWIRKNNPDCEIYIHEKPQAELLREHGYEKVPLLWRGQQIWIRRKPTSDQKLTQTSA